MTNWNKLRAGSEHADPKLREALEQLARELNAFDWFYAMSDDRSVYYRGLAQQQRLWAVARSLGDQGTKLFNQIRDLKMQ